MTHDDSQHRSDNDERFTMATIGRLLTEEQGRLTVRRVLSVDNGEARVETTFETEGSLRGVHYTTLATIQSAIRPDAIRPRILATSTTGRSPRGVLPFVLHGVSLTNRPIPGLREAVDHPGHVIGDAEQFTSHHHGPARRTVRGRHRSVGP